MTRQDPSRSIDTGGWNHVRRQAWHKDHRYTEVWASHDGRSWTMLGMDAPPRSTRDVVRTDRFMPWLER